MTQKQDTVVGNELIARFMGITRGTDKYYGGMADKRGSNEYPCWVYPDGKKFTHLYYHTSWDWLMPVVEKINKLNLSNIEHDYPRNYVRVLR